MYSHEERMRAVKLYVQYGCRAAAVIRELGYPDHQSLLRWYREYIKTGELPSKRKSAPRYSKTQKQAALKHYMEHGRCITYTIKTIGYPSATLFKSWLDEAFPDRKKRCVSGGAMVEYPQEKKEQAVIDLCARTGSASEVAQRHGVARETLYQWKKQLLGEEQPAAMPRKSTAKRPLNTDIKDDSIQKLLAEKTALEEQLALLKSDVYRLQLEHDILEKAGEILKKGQGISLKILTNREKAEVIDALRKKYRLKDLLQSMCISKSSYCYQVKCLRRPDKYAQLRAEVHIHFHETNGCYGYRRIHAGLKKAGIAVSEKVIRRIMKEESLAVRCAKRKKYSSYAGEISPEVANIVSRDFHAEAPNTKWLTDITEFSIPAGKVYLSPIIDCFDGLVVAWSIGTSPSAELVNSMLDEAVSLLQEDEHPIIHSDRGAHYRWPGWIERMEKAGLTRSMSKKGCSPDNSACEGFFGRLKNEMFYDRSWKNVSTDAFIEAVNDYIRWYNEGRIKESLGWMSPLEYRRSLGLAA
jgi:transposase InsO family protein/transposase-like protein